MSEKATVDEKNCSVILNKGDEDSLLNFLYEVKCQIVLAKSIRFTGTEGTKLVSGVINGCDKEKRTVDVSHGMMNRLSIKGIDWKNVCLNSEGTEKSQNLRVNKLVLKKKIPHFIPFIKRREITFFLWSNCFAHISGFGETRNFALQALFFLDCEVLRLMLLLW